MTPMTPDDELNEMLRDRFAGVRDADAREAPAFRDMVARARATMPQGAVAPVDVVEPVTKSPSGQRSRWRWAWAVAPLAVAAGLAAIWLAPGRAADREFERVVSEWSRTERVLNAPTDRLLNVPGSEYLRRLRPVGSGAGSPRRPS